MKIHEKLKEYYYLADLSKQTSEEERCNCTNCEDGCQWVSCGPHAMCLSVDKRRVPCQMCGFWSGYGMDDKDLYRVCLKLFVIEGEYKDV